MYVPGKEKKMPKFTRAKETVDLINDREGRVVVRIFLQDPKAAIVMPLNGNFKKDIVLEGTRVTEVVKEIEKILFGGES